LIADFSVVIAILLASLADGLAGLATEKLEVPASLRPSARDRDGWLLPLTHESNPWWSIFVALPPALFGSILVTHIYTILYITLK
ncbi:sodium bicarbonate transporter family protein, partial [Klebsiella pneumoniae]|nr:sodium bicarbonate transporter family protein [Klebsiella pneumoniae]